MADFGKKEIVRIAKTKVDHGTIEKCGEYYNAIFDTIRECLANEGDTVRIHSLGTFEVRRINNSRRIHPKTHEIISSQDRTNVRFKPIPSLKKLADTEEEE